MNHQSFLTKGAHLTAGLSHLPTYHTGASMDRAPADNKIDYAAVARMFNRVNGDTQEMNTIERLQEAEAFNACYEVFADEMEEFVNGESETGSGDTTPVNPDRPVNQPIDTELILQTTDPMFMYERVFFALQTCIEQPGIPMDPIQNEQNWEREWFDYNPLFPQVRP
jgi:hypothetical protein